MTTPTPSAGEDRPLDLEWAITYFANIVGDLPDEEYADGRKAMDIIRRLRSKPTMEGTARAEPSDPDCYCKGNPLIFCLKCGHPTPPTPNHDREAK